MCKYVMHAQMEAEREAARQAFSAGNAAAAGEVAGLRAELARALAAHRADEAALRYRRTKNEQEVEVRAHEPACLRVQGSAGCFFSEHIKVEGHHGTHMFVHAHFLTWYKWATACVAGVRKHQASGVCHAGMQAIVLKYNEEVCSRKEALAAASAELAKVQLLLPHLLCLPDMQP